MTTYTREEVLNMEIELEQRTNEVDSLKKRLKDAKKRLSSGKPIVKLYDNGALIIPKIVKKEANITTSTEFEVEIMENNDLLFKRIKN